MISFRKLIMLFFILFVLSAQTCEREDDSEVNVKDNEKLESLEVKKATAPMEWQKFMETASRQTSIADNQLKSLQARIVNMDRDENGERDSLEIEYERSSQLLFNLKALLDEQNSLQPQAEEYSAAMVTKNISFKSFFLHQIIELNNHLEDILGE